MARGELGRPRDGVLHHGRVHRVQRRQVLAVAGEHAFRKHDHIAGAGLAENVAHGAEIGVGIPADGDLGDHDGHLHPAILKDSRTTAPAGSGARAGIAYAMR